MQSEKIVLVAVALLFLVFSVNFMGFSSYPNLGNVVSAGNVGVIVDSREIYDVMLLACAAAIIVVWRYNKLIFNKKIGAKKRQLTGR